MSRRVVANFSLSLDGQVSGPAGEYDMGWIVPHAITDGSREHMLRVTESATTVLLGRKNYEGFGGFWPTVADNPDADPRDRRFSRWLNETEKVVFSSTLAGAGTGDGTGAGLTWANSRIVRADVPGEVKRLREQNGGDIIVLASKSVIRTLLEADLIDRLSITLCPEIVGGGATIFRDGLPASGWSCEDATPTESGAMCLLYGRSEHSQ